jgi:hypothetical protein
MFKKVILFILKGELLLWAILLAVAGIAYLVSNVL